MHRDSPEEALTRLILLVFRLNGRLLDAGDRMAAPVGQTSARWQVMGVIDHGPITVSGVARVMGLARQSVQRNADILVADGLALYQDNPADRRAQLVRLTPRGRKAVRAIEAAQQVWAARLGEALGVAALARAHATLERLEHLLEKEAAEDT